jgi:hypothetical protein
MKIQYLKILTVITLYYLIYYFVTNILDVDYSNNSFLNISFLIIDLFIPLSLFYFFFLKMNFTSVKSLYFSCFFALSICAFSQLCVKIYFYQFLDTERSSIIAEKIANRVIGKIESIETNNNIKIDTDKSVEYKKIYTSIKSKYEFKGIVKSALSDIFIYSIISGFFVYFIKTKMLNIESNDPIFQNNVKRL